jgi:hypothetical protein
MKWERNEWTISGNLYLQIRVKADDGGGGECKGQAQTGGEPVPVLGENHQSNYSTHVGVASPRLEWDGDIASASINNALGQNGTKLGHDIFVLVANDFGVELSDVFDLWRGEFGVLDEDKCRSQQCSLADIIDRIVHHWAQVARSPLYSTLLRPLNNKEEKK